MHLLYIIGCPKQIPLGVFGKDLISFTKPQDTSFFVKISKDWYVVAHKTFFICEKIFKNKEVRAF